MCARRRAHWPRASARPLVIDGVHQRVRMAMHRLPIRFCNAPEGPHHPERPVLLREYESMRVLGGIRFRCSARIPRVAAYTVNDVAVRHAKRLIDARQYVLRSRWQDVQPRAKEQNAYLKTHSWDEYAAWHLGLTEGAPDEAKARYAFVYGDL